MMSLFNKIKHKGLRNLYSFKNDLFWHLGSVNLNKKDLKGSCILVYHGIDRKDSRKYNTRFISQKRLAEHFRYFKQYFNIVPLQDLLTAQVDERKFNLAITFDDGYQNNLTYALPVLKQFQVPATFCITGIVDTPLPILWTDYLDIAARESKASLQIEGIKYVSKRRYPWSNFEYNKPSRS